MVKIYKSSDRRTPTVDLYRKIVVSEDIWQGQERVTSLMPSGYCMYHQVQHSKLYILLIKCISVTLFMDLRRSSTYFYT
jgi:hypothetical protein